MNFAKFSFSASALALANPDRQSSWICQYTDFTRFYHPIEPVHDVIERRFIVPHVVNIQIHVIKAQILQAGIDHLFNVPLPQKYQR